MHLLNTCWITGTLVSPRDRGKYLRCGPCGQRGLVQRVDGVRVVAQERNGKQFRMASAQALKGDRETGWSGREGWLRKGL